MIDDIRYARHAKEEIYYGGVRKASLWFMRSYHSTSDGYIIVSKQPDVKTVPDRSIVEGQESVSRDWCTTTVSRNL